MMWLCGYIHDLNCQVLHRLIRRFCDNDPFIIEAVNKKHILEACCAIWDIRLKLFLNLNLAKSRSSLAFVAVVLFCAEHGNGTVVLCAKFQDDWINLKGCYGRTRFREICV